MPIFDTTFGEENLSPIPWLKVHPSATPWGHALHLSSLSRPSIFLFCLEQKTPEIQEKKYKWPNKKGNPFTASSEPHSREPETASQESWVKYQCGSRREELAALFHGYVTQTQHLFTLWHSFTFNLIILPILSTSQAPWGLFKNNTWIEHNSQENTQINPGQQ